MEKKLGRTYMYDCEDEELSPGESASCFIQTVTESNIGNVELKVSKEYPIVKGTISNVIKIHGQPDSDLIDFMGEELAQKLADAIARESESIRDVVGYSTPDGDEITI